MAEKIDGSKLVLRPMTPADISLGMKLKSYAGWNQIETDWEMFISAGGKNFVANLDGMDVGTVTSVPYSNHFAWIGMVLVDPSARRKGVGTTLLKRSIDESLSIGAVRLDATLDGYELYKTLGFKVEYELIRMIRKSGPVNLENTGHCDQIRNYELSGVIAYDSPVFGAERSIILKSLYKRNPEYAICCSGKGELEGYCMGRSGSNFEQIGPVIAEDDIIAQELTIKALTKCREADVVIDAFVDNPGWTSFLKKIGFIEQRKFIRMCLGELKHPGLTGKQYAIAGPEIG